MEDTFRVRVDKVFGALGGDTAPSVGVSPSLWCLTDEEIERREWNRNKEVPEEGEDGGESKPLVVRTDLESDLKELSDGEDEEEDYEEEESEEIDGAKRRRRSNSGGSGEESNVVQYLDVQSNIGRDCTLDYEEEEDQYDKVAVGTDEIGDCVYLRNVKYADYEIDEVSGYPELPSSFQIAAKDPRANHPAAILRLREDAEAAGELESFKLSDSSMALNLDAEDAQKGEADNPKPILKKKESLMDTKSLKRVRFMVGPKSSSHEYQQTSGSSDLPPEPLAEDDNSVKKPAYDLSEYQPGVPDYIRNPSKYTHYTFNSSDDMDDELNRKAYANLYHDLRKRHTDTLMEERPVELPKSVVFTPKKKLENDTTAKSDSKLKTGENMENKRWSVDITAGDIQENDVSAMEEDEPGLAVDEGIRISQKSGRKYRTKSNIEINDTIDRL